MKNIIKNLYFFLVFLTPVFFLILPEEPFETNKTTLVYLFTGLIFFFWAWKVLAEKKISLIRNRLVIFVLLFFLLNLVSLVFSVHPYTSIIGNSWRYNGGVLSLFSYILLFLIFVETFHGEKEVVKEMLYSILLSSAFVSIYGIYQLYSLGNWSMRITSTLGQPNFVGTYLVFVLPINIYFLTIEKKIFYKVLVAALLLANILALVLTASRSAWFAFLVLIIVALIVLGKKFLWKNKKVLLVALIFLSIVGYSFRNQISSRINLQLFREITNDQQQTNGTFALRFFAWKGALQIARDHPLLGTGPETFMYSFPKYRDPKLNMNDQWSPFFDRSHNELLDILANTGVFALLAYLAIMFFALKYALFSKKKNPLSITLGLSFLGIFLCNLAGFSVVTTALYFWLSVGMILVLQESKVKQLKLGVKKWLVATVLAFLILMTGLFYFEWGKIYLATVYSGWSDYENATKYNPHIDRYWGMLAIEQLSAGQYDLALKSAERTVEECDKHSESYRILAIVYSSKPEDKEAQSKTIGAYNKAIELDPSNATIYLEEAKYLINIGEKEQAKQALEKTLELKLNYPEAQDLLKTIN